VNKVVWIVLTVFWVLAGCASTLGAMMSVMLFDAPGSTESRLTVALFWCLLALPFSWFLGAGLPWLFRSKGFGKWLFAIPLVDVAAIVGVFVAIDQFCGGALSCK
jgi:hypothetical protein